MLDWFNLLLLAMVLLVVGFIVFGIRKTLAEVRESGVSGNEARELAKRIRERDIRCPRCKGKAFGLLGTKVKYKCHSCNYVFEGPEHIPVS
jgi:transposase-like protein